MKLNLEEHILIYATKYAVGRRTYAVEDVVKCIIENWSKLSGKTKSTIKEIIKKSLHYGEIEDDCDKENWKKILELTK